MFIRTVIFSTMQKCLIVLRAENSVYKALFEIVFHVLKWQTISNVLKSFATTSLIPWSRVNGCSWSWREQA
jgi:hypothetical protein